MGFSQIYEIPNAEEQPAWVFPLWFEDATGARDTLFFGYDPNAENFGYPQSDTIFGEKLIPSDTSKFMAYWEQGLTIDEIFKVVIWKDFYPSTIFFKKAKLPLKVTWDNNLFYSENLPFPNNSPLPNAWGLVHCALVGFEGCQIIEEDAIVITDTPDYDVWGTFITDSLWFDSGEYEYFANYLDFEVLEYGYAHGWMVIENEINKYSNLSPNPSSEYINLNLESYFGGSILILDFSGKIIQKYSDITSNVIDIRDLPTGIYFLSFNKDNIQLTQKFIKL